MKLVIFSTELIYSIWPKVCKQATTPICAYGFNPKLVNSEIHFPK